MRVFPRLKSNAVTNAPTQTLRHEIFTSGSSLKIMAKSIVITPSETRKLTTAQRIRCSGRKPLANLPTAAKAALSDKETRSKNPTPKTMAKESSRCRMKSRRPRPGFGSTFQIVFKSSCNSTKTAVAPRRSVVIAAAVAQAEARGLSAAATNDWIAWPPLWPTNPDT